MSGSQVSFETARIEEMLHVLERLAGGETSLRLPLSRNRDHLDALAHGVNGIAQELVYAKEAAEQASQAKTRFLAMMSHEIRTPLTAVLGLADAIRDPSLGAAERDGMLERLRANGRLLLSIVDNVLDLSKIEAGRLEVRREWVAPREVAGEVLLALEPLAQAKGLKLTCSCDAGVPDFVEADPARLRQVLANVVGNAIKFTAKGEVRLSLACAGVPTPVLEVEVNDTGIGIEEECQAQLFHPFAQAGPSVAASYGGTGLGLVIGRRFAELMGGTLRLRKSTPGVGSVFVLTLPLPERREPGAAGAAHPARGAHEKRFTGANRLAGVKALLAEDSPDLQLVFRRFLELEGASVRVVGDGLAALEACEGEAYDIFLLDVNMPRMSGIEAARTLRSRAYRQPILALTAHALGLHEQECREAGYTASLSKPFQPETLTRKILELLGSRGPA